MAKDIIEAHVTREMQRAGLDNVAEYLKALGMPVTNNKYGGVIALKGVMTKRICPQTQSDVYLWKSVDYILNKEGKKT